MTFVWGLLVGAVATVVLLTLWSACRLAAESDREAEAMLRRQREEWLDKWEVNK